MSIRDYKKDGSSNDSGIIVCLFRTVVTVVITADKDCHFLFSTNCVVRGGQISVNVIFYRSRIVKSIHCR